MRLLGVAATAGVLFPVMTSVILLELDSLFYFTMVCEIDKEIDYFWILKNLILKSSEKITNRITNKLGKQSLVI